MKAEIDEHCHYREGEVCHPCMRDGCDCVPINQDVMGAYIMYIGSKEEDPEELKDSTRHYRVLLMNALERLLTTLDE